MLSEGRLTIWGFREDRIGELRLGEAYLSGVLRNFPNTVIIHDCFYMPKPFKYAFDKLLSDEMKVYGNLKKEMNRLPMNVFYKSI